MDTRKVKSGDTLRRVGDTYEVGEYQFTYGTEYKVLGPERAEYIISDAGRKTPLGDLLAPWWEHLPAAEQTVEETVSAIMDGVAVANPWNASPEDVADQDILTAAVSDIVVRPAHYTSWVIEPITFIMRNGMEFWRGNIIKYVSRAGRKLYDGMDAIQSEIADLEKVRRYAEMRINQLKGEAIL